MDKNLARISLLIFSTFSICAAAIASLYGPFHVNIQLGTPYGGYEVDKAIRDLRNAPAVLVPGDKVVLCNSNACVTYTKTSTGWLGGPPTKQEVVDGGGGNGGGGGDGGGGGGGGGGGWTPTPPPPSTCPKCTVTVG